jgi:hypothetical protein
MQEPEIVERARLLREAEERHHVQATVQVIAALELIGSLVEGEEGFNYADCLTGLIGLGFHCNENDEAGLRILPPSYVNIARSFFWPDQEAEADVRNVGGVIVDFKKDPTGAVAGHTQRNTFETVKTWLQSSEQEFAMQIDQLINEEKAKVMAADPDVEPGELRKKTLERLTSRAIEDEIAASILEDAARRLQKPCSVQEIKAMGDSLIQHIPLAVGFIKWVLYTVVDRDIDMFSKTSQKKRWNWIWDYQVTFLISDVSVNNKTSLVVTADQDIHEVLGEHGFEDRALKLPEYLYRLGVPQWKLAVTNEKKI